MAEAPSEGSPPVTKKPRLASSMGPPPPQVSVRAAAEKKRPSQRSGRWTAEESRYVEGLIKEFNAGLLPIAEGTTMRSFLARMLECNPKRVSKKYDGNGVYDGKQTYTKARHQPPAAELCNRQARLLELQRDFRQALCTFQRVESKLKTLTAVRTEDSLAEAKEPADSQVSWPSSSAVSSLTDDDEEWPAGVAVATIVSQKTAANSIAQVSEGQDSDSSNNNNNNRRIEDQEVGRMLLQLMNSTAASRKRPAQDSAHGTNGPSFNGDKLLQNLQQTQARDVEAAAAAKTCPKDSATDASNLQALLLLIKEMEQPQAAPAAAGQAKLSADTKMSDLRKFLAKASRTAEPQRIEPPVLAQRNAGENFLELLHSLQSQRSVTAQSPQTSSSASLNLSSLLPQRPAEPKEEQKPQANSQLQGLLNSILHQSVQQQERTAQTGPEDVLKALLQSQAENSTQNNSVSVMRALLQSNQEGASQYASATIQSVMQTLAAHDAARKQHNDKVEAALGALIDQMRSSVEPQQKQAAFYAQAAAGAVQNSGDLQGLLQSIATNQQHAAPAPPSQQQQLQQLLATLQSASTR